jgi:gamma-glutamylcyclotransferase (GGCT)/AIG2-like uncharacterized protein YtfP
MCYVCEGTGMKKIFVYGTLRKGNLRDSMLKDSTYIGKFKSKKKYDMIHLSAFPGLLEDGKTSITGEVYEVDSKTLFKIDLIEGHPNFYKRKEIKLKGINDVEAYFLPRWKYGKCEVIKSGDWLNQ